MIVQQINLYQDRFREKRLWVSAAQVAVMVLILVTAVAAWSFLLQVELRQAEQHNRLVKADRERLTNDLNAANAELTMLLQDDRLDKKIELTARQVSARNKVLNFVEANRFGSGEGFSGYLVALSKLHVDDLWLNRILFSENFVRIEGSTLDAARVPGYFDRFSDEQIFQGLRFDMFRLNRDENTDWKVDFEIATREPLDE